jgi:hypothetical protein
LVNLAPIPDFIHLKRQREGVWDSISFGVSDCLDLDGAGRTHDQGYESDGKVKERKVEAGK